MRSGTTVGIVAAVIIVLSLQLNLFGAWSITMPAGGSSRAQTASVDGSGFPQPGGYASARLIFGPDIAGVFHPERDVSVQSQNAAGMLLWSGTVYPPTTSGRWSASPIDPATGMPIGQHSAVIIDIDGNGDSTDLHKVTVVP